MTDERSPAEGWVACYESPIGLIEVEAEACGVTAVRFVEKRRERTDQPRVLREAVSQLAEYFESGRQEFTVPLVLGGTEFQRKVWRRLTTIPFGRTASYLEIAQGLGRPGAVRAVGAANGRNPISIIVPCHRVIGSDGTLTGYGGGLWRKEWLLRHEGVNLI